MVKHDPQSVSQAAQERGWTQVAHNETSRVLGYTRGDERVNVYYTTGTVGTCVDHPSSGRTQLFRQGQDSAGLNDIFDNPRVHTGTGYYRKSGK